MEGTQSGKLSILPNLKWISPQLEDTSKPDEEVVTGVANQLLEGEGIHQGYLLDGFPFSVNQALLLDRLIRGVHLAIFIRSGSKSHE